jgi:hypothetical protein
MLSHTSIFLLTTIRLRLCRATPFSLPRNHRKGMTARQVIAWPLPASCTDGSSFKQSSTLVFHGMPNRPTSEYEIVKTLRTDGQAVKVVVVRKKPTYAQKFRHYLQTTKTQKVQEFVRKTYLLGHVLTGRIWASRGTCKENVTYFKQLNTHTLSDVQTSKL